MGFERVSLLFLVVPPVLWMVFNSQRNDNRFLLKAFGVVLVILAFCLPGFVLRDSRAAANVLADSLAGLSETELEQEYDFV